MPYHYQLTEEEQRNADLEEEYTRAELQALYSIRGDTKGLTVRQAHELESRMSKIESREFDQSRVKPLSAVDEIHFEDQVSELAKATKERRPMREVPFDMDAVWEESKPSEAIPKTTTVHEVTEYQPSDMGTVWEESKPIGEIATADETVEGKPEVAIPDWWETIKSPAVSGASQFNVSLFRVLKDVNRVFKSPDILQNKLLDVMGIKRAKSPDLMNKAIEAGMQWAKKTSKDFDISEDLSQLPPYHPKRILGTGVQALPQIGGVIAGALAGGAPGASAMLGTIAYGLSAEEAKTEGANEVQQVLHGITAAEWEVLTELPVFSAVGEILKLTKKSGIPQKVTKSFGEKILKGLGLWGLAGVAETLQEPLSDIGAQLSKRVFYDPEAEISLKQALESAYAGTSMWLTMSLLGLPSVGVNVKRMYKEGKSEQEIANEIISQVDPDAYMAQIKTGINSGKLGITELKTIRDSDLTKTLGLENQVDSLTKKVKEQKPETQDTIDVSKMIAQGMATGKVGGQPFTPETAAGAIKVAYEEKVFTDDHIEKFKEQYPVLKQELDKIVPDAKAPGAEEVALEEKEPVSAEVKPPEVVVERRTDVERRKRIAEMSPEEMKKELLVNPATGIPNKRALQERELEYLDKDVVTSRAFLDVDSLKYVNDLGGHAAGDLLLKAVASEIEKTTPDGFHISGDEFIILGKNEQEARAFADKVNEQLSRKTIEFTDSDGNIYTYKGMGISYGVHKEEAGADELLRKHKEEREREGLRAARGEVPPGLSKKDQEKDRESRDKGFAEPGKVEKEPFEMDKAEFTKHVKGDYGNPLLHAWTKRKWEEQGKPEGKAGMALVEQYDKYGMIEGERRATIEQAIFEGKEVPQKVLKDYPDLTGKIVEPTPKSPKAEKQTPEEAAEETVKPKGIVEPTAPKKEVKAEEKPAPVKEKPEEAFVPELVTLPLETITVKTSAIREVTGETITVEENAKDALADIDRDLEKYLQILSCLRV